MKGGVPSRYYLPNMARDYASLVLSPKPTPRRRILPSKLT